MRPSTQTWVTQQLDDGERIIGTQTLHGGMTAEVLRLKVKGYESTRFLVLRSYVSPFALHHSKRWLGRESHALTMLDGTGVPAPNLVAVDPTAEYCEYPSLLMSHLPGGVVLTGHGVEMRVRILARKLVDIHDLKVVDPIQKYESLTTAETVVIPEEVDNDSWHAAIALMRGSVPCYEPRFLHGDYQPGNVLFAVNNAGSDDVRLTGVVDWAGASWGPADFDVAHCATNLALLHGPKWGPIFTTAYEGAGGKLARKMRDRQYWFVRDVMACSEEVQLWARPWREAGRTDLTPRVIRERLNSYLSILMNV